MKTLTLFEPVRFNLLLADPEHDAIGQAIIGVGRRIGWHALSGRTLAMPIHLITGTRSPLPARSVTELIARECVHAKIVRLEGMGHMGPVTDASRVAPHLAFQREAPFALAA